jgi:hypothetical protein
MFHSANLFLSYVIRITARILTLFCDSTTHHKHTSSSGPLVKVTVTPQHTTRTRDRQSGSCQIPLSGYAVVSLGYSETNGVVNKDEPFYSPHLAASHSSRTKHAGCNTTTTDSILHARCSVPIHIARHVHSDARLSTGRRGGTENVLRICSDVVLGGLM